MVDITIPTLSFVDHSLVPWPPCPRCGQLGPHVIGPGTPPHYASARCRYCGHFWWLSRYTAEERQARRELARQEAMATRPPSQRQLAYLAALGDDGPPPATMAEASKRIDARVRGEVGA